jgi:hypothetical protein
VIALCGALGSSAQAIEFADGGRYAIEEVLARIAPGRA